MFFYRFNRRKYHDYEKRGYALIFANNGEIELLYLAIESIKDLRHFSSYSFERIEQYLFFIVNQEYERWRTSRTISSIAHYAEKIAELFLVSGFNSNTLLRIKMLSFGAQGMTASMTDTARQLFAVSPDYNLAHNIIVGLLEQKKKRTSDFKLYLDYLNSSSLPIHSLVIASVMKRLGKDDDFELYLYKALFDLNGKDDFEVYEVALGLILPEISKRKALSAHNDVMDNDVI